MRAQLLQMGKEDRIDEKGGKGMRRDSKDQSQTGCYAPVYHCCCSVCHSVHRTLILFVPVFRMCNTTLLLFMFLFLHSLVL